jgi:hypothetical protein
LDVVDPGFVVGAGVAVVGSVVVALVVESFGVPAYVSAASHPKPAVATSPATSEMPVRSDLRRLAVFLRPIRARSSGVMTAPCRPNL